MTAVAAAVSVPAWLVYAPAVERSDWTLTATLATSILVSGLLLSPDLDLNSSIYKRWGPLRCIWWPYQKCVRHRSVVSHSFVLGPLLRLAYLLFACWAIFRIVTWGLDAYGVTHLDRNGISVAASHSFVAFLSAHPHHVVLALIGLLIGAGLHVLADIVWTGIKKRY